MPPLPAASSASAYCERGTRRRVWAPHTCPERCMAPPTTRGTTVARSASSRAIAADLPPSSRDTGLTCSPHRLMIRLPAAVDPVNATLSAPGWVTRCSPTSRPPGTTLTTPAGTPASSRASARMKLLSGASGGGLITTVQPAASAGAVFQAARVTGAFQGTIAATTPTGSLVTRPARSPATTRRSNGKVPDQLGVVVEHAGDEAGLRHGRLADGAAHLVDGHPGDVGLALAQQLGGAAPARRPARPAPSGATGRRRTRCAPRPRPRRCRRRW